MGEDHRAVLGAEIWSLAVELGGVVHLEEEIHQRGIGDLGGIKCHFHHFGVVGVAMADLLVAGIIAGTAGIAAHRLTHAGDLQEEILYAPKAARAE